MIQKDPFVYIVESPYKNNGFVTTAILYSEIIIITIHLNGLVVIIQSVHDGLI